MLHFYYNFRIKKIIIFFGIILVFVGVYNGFLKPLPNNVSAKWEEHFVKDSDVVFIADETYIDGDGIRKVEQNIFDGVFKIIDNAKKYILVDMFLYNDFQGKHPERTREISKELTEALIKKKKETPNISIIVISDPINTIYGGQESVYFKDMEKAGINVVLTNLQALRDSNPIYSSFWRVLIKWFGNSNNGGFLINPFQYNGHLVTARSYFSLFNFKANHRKLIVADDGNNTSVLITSANPHDGSSAHSNSAIIVKNGIWKDVLNSEYAIGKFSNKEINTYDDQLKEEKGDVEVQLVTEGEIKSKFIEQIQKLNSSDELDMAMFYLSDRDIVNELKRADERGVEIRIILDPNKDAFGHEKNGVPNRPVANELISSTKGNTQLRWCDTHGEQCHTKLTIFRYGDAESLLIGSANLTRRNIGDYNLETDVFVKGEKVTAIDDAINYFDKIWENTEDEKYTVPYDVYADSSFFKKVLYRIMEGLGTSTF